MRKIHAIPVFFLAAILAIATMLSVGCGLVPATSGSDTLQSLAAVEIKAYEGKDLSSLLEFRENSIKGTQNVDIGTYRLTVDGLVEQPVELTYEEVLENTRYTKIVRLNCVEGWSVDILWEGILLADLFTAVKAQPAANTVIFHSYDGYTTSLPLAGVLEKDMILAFKMNGVELPPERGFPFQLVAEDKLGYKWAKWITRIELSSDEDYRGYWEQRGYSNEAAVKD